VSLRARLAAPAERPHAGVFATPITGGSAVNYCGRFCDPNDRAPSVGCRTLTFASVDRHTTPTPRIATSTPVTRPPLRSVSVSGIDEKADP